MTRRAHILPCAILLALICSGAQSQQTHFAKIGGIGRAPEIDGILSAGEWDDAAVIDKFHQVSPIEFAEPSQDTVFYVKYDKDFLYIAAHCYDSEPDKIITRVLRQGASLFSDDHITVIIDSFNNNRSGYFFEMNANGVREEGIYPNGATKSDDWDGVWRGAANVVADGWTVEFEIPFKTLSFPPENSIWGFNFVRRVSRNAEFIAWTSHAGRMNPTATGLVDGFDGLSQGLGLDVVPSASSTNVRSHIDDSSESEFRPSLDINYKLTPSINAVLTLNTDFAATEVDSRQLDVSRFSLFFPEKRSFFLTDFDIFQFGAIEDVTGGGSRIPGSASGNNGLAFFSRRIGLSADREPVDLTGGLKLSGRAGKMDFGALYVRQEDFEDIDASDLFIARVLTSVLDESSVGAILTHGDPTTNATGSTAGLDFQYRNTRIGKNRSLEGQFWVQNTNNDGFDGDDWAWSAAFGMPVREGVEWGGQIHEAQANYDPRLGFANRTGVRLYAARLGYKWVNEDRYWFQRVNSTLDFERWEFLDTGLLQSQRTQFTVLNVRNGSNDRGRIRVLIEKERLLDGENPLDSLGIDVPAGEYSFNRYEVFLRTATFRPLAFELSLGGGDFYNGERFTLSAESEWRVNKHVAFELEYTYNDYDFPGADAITRQITLENSLALNANWSLLTLAQYDNLSADIGVNMRLRYNRQAGQDFWFVLNHNMREFDPTDPEYRGSGFRSVETAAAVKLRYTFRF